MSGYRKPPTTNVLRSLGLGLAWAYGRSPRATSPSVEACTAFWGFWYSSGGTVWGRRSRMQGKAPALNLFEFGVASGRVTA